MPTSFAHPYFRRPKPGIRYPHAGSQNYEPGALPAAYGLTTAVEVKPMTIVIGELGGKFYPSDVQPWASHAGMPAPTVRTHILPGGDDSPSDADGEVALDWQRAAEFWSYMTGTPADILIVYGPNSGQAFADVMNYCAALPNVGAGSWSWGSSEDNWSQSDLSAYDAAAKACPFPWCAASGDNDANDGSGHLITDAPSCVPSNIGCGGTNRPPSGGAETVWNDGGGEGTGGGFSKVYPRPSWQPINSQGDGRMVPDIAMVADPQTGYNTLINGQWQTIGGTSAVAPNMAGYMAVVNGFRAKNGLPLLGVSALPALWAARSCFLDITSGNNSGYSATVGPDPCSGLGRPLAILFGALTGAVTPPPPPPPPPPPTTDCPKPSEVHTLGAALKAGKKVQLTFTPTVNEPKGSQMAIFPPGTFPHAETGKATVK